METRLETVFRQEMSLARSAFQRGALADSFSYLERAHILGQRRTSAHMLTHWWMLRIGWRRRDHREIRGQILRLAAALLLSRIWVPVGNTGGANVSPIKSMPIPADLIELLRGR